MPAPGLADAIRSALASAGDPSRAVDQQRYMKSAMPFRGVRVPEVRRLVGAIMSAWPQRLDRAAFEALARELWDAATFREERYAALAVCRHRLHRTFQTPELLPLYRHFVVTGAWWDLVDEISHCVGHLLASSPEALTPVIRAWGRDPNVWVRRVAIISQLGRGPDTDTALLAAVITPNIADGEFFIRKAIGWALRQYARTDPGWVAAFVATHELSPLSRREALKHLG